MITFRKLLFAPPVSFCDFSLNCISGFALKDGMVSQIDQTSGVYVEAD